MILKEYNGCIYTDYENQKRKCSDYEEMIEHYLESKNTDIKYDKLVSSSEVLYSFVYKDIFSGGIILSCDNRYTSFGVNGISFSMKGRKITKSAIEEMLAIIEEISYENDK